MLKYKAYYVKKGANPFSLHPKKDDIVSITAEVPEGTTDSEVEKMAKTAIPPGYDFSRIEKLK